MPVDPKTLIGDGWMDDPKARAEFEAGLLKLDEALKPITDALDASVRLTAKDWDVYFTPFD